jgi:hypothetical protein
MEMVVSVGTVCAVAAKKLISKKELAKNFFIISFNCQVRCVAGGYNQSVAKIKELSPFVWLKSEEKK